MRDTLSLLVIKYLILTTNYLFLLADLIDLIELFIRFTDNFSYTGLEFLTKYFVSFASQIQLLANLFFSIVTLVAFAF